jgi:hypothetical protein
MQIVPQKQVQGAECKVDVEADQDAGCDSKTYTDCDLEADAVRDSETDSDCDLEADAVHDSETDAGCRVIVEEDDSDRL